MSRTVEKSVVPISEFLNSLFGGTGTHYSYSSNIQNQQQSTSHYSASSGFVSFIERLEAARKISKQEEEELLIEEYQSWVKQASHQIGSSIMADILCRSLLAFSRGHYFTNLHINAIKLTQCDKLANKKIGYLYITRTMAPGSDLSVLLINTMLKDLSSNNCLDVYLGLSLVPIVFTQDFSSVIANSLLVCFRKQQEFIRKRAIIMAAIIAIQTNNNDTSYASVILPCLFQLLTDVDPSVAMAAADAASHIYQVVENEGTRDDISNRVTICCAHILRQATSGMLSTHYNSRAIAAPFVQVKMLRLIRHVVATSSKVQALSRSAIHSVLSQPWGGRDLTLYMTYIEGIITAAHVQKNDKELVSISLDIILGFLKSSNVDFKYLGIKTLTQIFGYVEEELTQTHLESVLECLYSSNFLLQSRTVSLLCAMAKGNNYQAVCMTLKELLQRPSSHANRSAILINLMKILKRLNVDLPWCIEFLTPFIMSNDFEQFEVFEALTLATSNAFAKTNSRNEKMRLVASCNKFFNELLDLKPMSFQHLDIFSAILNIIFEVGMVDELLSSTIKKYIETIKNEHCSKTSDNIIECLLNCGLFIPNCKDLVIMVMQEFLKTTDLYLCYNVEEKISFLNHSDITRRILQKRSKIVAGELAPDFSSAVYDPACKDFCGKNLSCSFSLDLSLLMQESAHEMSDLDLSFSCEKRTGFKNPFDTHSCSPTNTNTDQDSSSISESMQSTTFEATNSFISSKPFNKSVWTSKGRVTEQADSYRTISEISEGDLNVSTASSSSVSSSCIEIAHEANESLMQEESLNDNFHSLSFIESHKADLTKALLKGLGFSKE